MFVRGEATILHADLDAFYASVEQRDDPRLRGRPVIVGGGVVLAASYEAKACGVRTAMGGRQARALCPGAIVVRPRMSAYSEASKAVFEVFRHTTPLVEGMSIDEAFLDVGGLRRIAGTPVDIATRLRREVASGWGCRSRSGWRAPSSWPRWPAGWPSRTGCWWCRPTGSWPSCTRCRWSGCGASGAVTAAKLHALGVRTVGQVAELGEAALVSILGRAPGGTCTRWRTTTIRARSRCTAGAARSARSARWVAGERSARSVDAILAGIIDRVSRRLRAAAPGRRTVVLRLRFADFTRATRSHTLPEATAHTQTILAAARGLLVAARPKITERGLTLLGVSLAELYDDRYVQLALPFEQRSGPALDRTLDSVRDRFGAQSVTRATQLGRSPGLTVRSCRTDRPA